MNARTGIYGIVVALAAALATLGCGSQWPAVGLDTLPGEAEYPDDHAIVLDTDVQVSFVWDDERGAPEAHTASRRRWKVLTETGRQQLEQFAITYDEQLGGVADVRARIIKPDGTQIEVDDIEDHPAGGAGSVLHTSGRIRLVSFAEAAPGDVIEVAWRKRSQVIFQPLALSFGERYPTVRSRVLVRNDPGLEIATRFTHNGAELSFDPTPTEIDGQTWLVWQRDDHEPLRGKHFYLPPSRLRAPMLRVALRAIAAPGGVQRYYNSWADYGPWYADLSRGTDTITPSVREAADRVLASTSSAPVDLVRQLFRHVQADVRYVAIELGMGGWRPSTADEVAQQLLGDCKDKASYLKALLATRDIDSQMVIIGTRNTFGARAPAANLRAANHAILAIDLPGQERLFVDPTCRACPLEQLPWTDEDTDVLVVGDGAAEVVRTPGSDAKATLDRRTYRVTVGAKGNANYALTTEATGQVAIRRRRKLFNRNLDEREDYVHELTFDEPRRAMKTFEVKGLDDLDDPLVIEAQGSVSALADGTDSSRVLSVRSFVTAPLPRMSAKRPPMPAHFRYPATWTVSIDAELPGHEITWVAPTVELSTPFARYRRHVERTATGARIERELTLEVRELPASTLPALRAFLDAVHTHDAEGLVLVPRTQEVNR